MTKPYSFLLYILAILFCFIAGASITGFIIESKNLGLAAGATVLVYGVFFAIIGLLLALVIANKTSRKLIFRLNIILAIGTVVFCVFLLIKNLDKKNTKSDLAIKTSLVL